MSKEFNLIITTMPTFNHALSYVGLTQQAYRFIITTTFFLMRWHTATKLNTYNVHEFIEIIFLFEYPNNLGKNLEVHQGNCSKRKQSFLTGFRLLYNSVKVQCLLSKNDPICMVKYCYSHDNSCQLQLQISMRTLQYGTRLNIITLSNIVYNI